MLHVHQRLPLLLLLLSPIIPHAQAQTASDGCHYCLTNCAKWNHGTRHCPKNSNLPQYLSRYIPRNILRIDYPGFTLHFDCALGRPLSAQYRLEPDTGNFDRPEKFHVDNMLPAKCKKQTSTASYKSKNTTYKYDRGHLVPANHLDHNQNAIRASFLMSNIVPQERSLNRNGAWRETEKIIECWREEGPLLIWIATLWGNHDNDHFVNSHGIETPEAFVKLVYKPKTKHTPAKAQSWLLPNIPVKAQQLDSLRIPPHTASLLIPEKPELPGINPATLSRNWPVPTCSQS